MADSTPATGTLGVVGVVFVTDKLVSFVGVAMTRDFTGGGGVFVGLLFRARFDDLGASGAR
jgi:hypothetical protein